MNAFSRRVFIYWLLLCKESAYLLLAHRLGACLRGGVLIRGITGITIQTTKYISCSTYERTCTLNLDSAGQLLNSF